MTRAREASSYLQHLPPVLWRGRQPGFSLGPALRIFEKILTGIDDGEPVLHDPGGERSRHHHDGLERVIEDLQRLFDPWRVQARFLPWLAGWVGLVLPPAWDEYQQRKAIAEIAQIWSQRGVTEGMRRHLDLFTVATTRPRIVVDDSAKVLFCRPVPERAATVHALVSQGPFVRGDRSVAHSGLVRPRCVALTPDGDLLVGDAGMPGDTAPVKPAVWRVSRTGSIVDTTGVPPSPRPLGHPGWDLKSALAIAVDPAVQPWRAYVLDFAGSRLYRLDAPALDRATEVATTAQLRITQPAGMAFDTDGRLLILDRSAAVVAVDVSVTPPVAAAPRALPQVVAARSLLVRGDGSLVIGDAREPDSPTPADLVVVDRTDPANWVQRRLLAELPAGENPLVAPFAVVEEDADHLLVLDIGLKPEADQSEPFLRTIAEPAAIYRVALGTRPRVRRASEPGRMVFPTGMVRHEDTLYVCDAGEPELTTQRRRDWRSAPHEFGVVVHFSKQRPPTDAQQKAIIRDISEIVATQKPAATIGTLISAVGTGS